MKLTNNFFSLILGIGMVTLSACNDKLDIVPPSSITPEDYLLEESQLEAYTINRYGQLPVNDPFASDNQTDVQAGMSVPAKYTKGEWKVDATGGDWDWGEMYHINYFLNNVVPRHAKGEISGDPDMINHYIGEMYFFRALQHYKKLVAIGDAPIVTRTYKDEKAELVEASKRMPRTEVARFIIQDLDSAIMLMKQESPDGKRNRLSKPVAQLLKSRVALFEGTWLKYFKGTAFVPNGPGWPGASKDYNQGYQFQSGSIDNEINWFLEQAIQAADEVASNFTLTSNTGILPQGVGESNPFVEMYGAIDMSIYDEVLLWKAYDKGLDITNNIPVNSSTSNLGVGVTKGMVDTYLMKNGLPWYAPGSGYHGDESIADVRADRDDRAYLFLKEPGQINMWINTNMGTHGAIVEPFLPNITSGSEQFRYNTGYTNRKGVNPDKALCDNWGGYNGCIVYRAVEAYLNYIEAYYERYQSLDSKAMDYWKRIRERAGVDTDIQKTIDATDMSKEALANWGAYSAGALVDKTLYNIRRERCCEFMAEGYRMDDLRRWRSLDQLINQPYHIEGMKIWGEYYPAQYAEAAKTDKTYELIYGVDNPEANVSSPELSKYLRPYQIARTLAYDGFTWKMAHYLNPIAIKHFQLTSEAGGDYADSPIYQNPGWPLRANEAAEE